MPTCGTCKHFRRYPECSECPEDYGYCQMIQDGVLGRIALEPCSKVSVWAAFGCVMHEPKPQGAE